MAFHEKAGRSQVLFCLPRFHLPFLAAGFAERPGAVNHAISATCDAHHCVVWLDSGIVLGYRRVSIQIDRSHGRNRLYDPKVTGVELMRLYRFRADTSPLSSSTTRRNWGAGLSVLLIGGCLGLPTYSAAQQRASIPQTPRAVQNGTAQLIGPYGSEQMLRLVFALKPPHLEEEEQFLNQLQDRDSPLFHKYMSEKEWNERFAPSPQDEQAVAAWAQSQGLTITQRYANRLLVDVEAPVATIEKALDVSINRYQIGSASYFSNDRDPSIPEALANAVHAVLGLNNIEVAHAASKGAQNFTGPDYSPGPAYAVGSHLVSDAKKPRAATSGRKKHPDWWVGEVYGPPDLWAAGGYNFGGTNPFNLGGLYNLGHCCNPLNNPNNSPPAASIAIVIWGDFLR